MDLKALHEKIDAYLAKNKLKSTKQRDVILDAFFNMKEKHIKIDELYQKVRKKNPSVGYATVYRTLMLLVKAKVASQRQFNDGQSQFEVISDRHHDHLICNECNNIIEFENQKIENLQLEVAAKFKFKLTGHKMELYGICSDCQKISDLGP